METVKNASKKSNWAVCIGFATGQPKYHTNRWFSITETIKNVTRSTAIKKVRMMGYEKSDDICADWIFWVNEDIQSDDLTEFED